MRDDSKFLLFWVLIWDPIVCAGYSFLMPALQPMTLTNALLMNLAFVYVVFAPALYRVFRQDSA